MECPIARARKLVKRSARIRGGTYVDRRNEGIRSIIGIVVRSLVARLTSRRRDGATTRRIYRFCAPDEITNQSAGANWPRHRYNRRSPDKLPAFVDRVGSN